MYSWENNDKLITSIELTLLYHNILMNYFTPGGHEGIIFFRVFPTMQNKITFSHNDKHLNLYIIISQPS